MPSGSGPSDPVADRVAAALASLLQTGDDVARCAAVECLAHLVPGPADVLLVGALQDPDVDVRILAAGALGAAQADRAGPALLRSVVDDPSGEVKEAAIRSIGRLGYRDDPGPLRRLACDRDPEMAWDVEDAEGEAWDPWLDVQVAAIEALGRLGDCDAVPAIVAALEDDLGQDVEPSAFAALAALGQSGIDALTARLQRGSARSRRRAAEALAQSRDPAAIPIQMGLARHPLPDIRRAAAMRLLAGDPKGTPFATFLRDSDPQIRAAAVRQCADSQLARCSPLASDPDRDVRLAVVEALACPDPGSRAAFTGTLRLRLNDLSDDVAAAAARALAGTNDELAQRNLIELAEDARRSPAVRGAAAVAVGGMVVDRALATLSAVIEDADPMVRLSACLGLRDLSARVGDLGVRARQVLLDHLREPPADADKADPVAGLPSSPTPAASDDDDRSDATSTLQAIERSNTAATTPVLPPVVTALGDDEARFLRIAETMPRRQRRRATPEVPAAIDRPRTVARVLADVRGAGVIEGLVAALAASDPELRREAAAALSVHADLPDWAACGASVAPLIELTEAADPNLRVYAVRSLGRLQTRGGNAAAIGRAIERLLDDPEPAVVRNVFGVVGDTDRARARAAAALSSADGRIGAAALAWMVRTGHPDALDAAVDFALTREAWDGVLLGEILPVADQVKAADRLATIIASTTNPSAALAAVSVLKTLTARVAGPPDLQRSH